MDILGYKESCLEGDYCLPLANIWQGAVIH